MVKSKNNPKIEIYIGISGSGKSTQAAKEAKDERKIIVSRDALRFAFKNQYDTMGDTKFENFISEMSNRAIEEAYMFKYDVILDNTHLREKYILEVIERFSDRFDISCRLFDQSNSVLKCIENVRNRPQNNQISDEIIIEQNKKYQVMASLPIVYETKIAKKPKYVKRDVQSGQRCVLFDIDGTLAHNDNRDIYDLSKIKTDTIDDTVRFLNSIIPNDVHVIVLSGRTEKDGKLDVKQKTIEWLRENGVRFDDIFMRKENDYRNDSIVKQEILEDHIIPKYNILFAVDDRERVVQMMRKMNIVVFQVADGKF